MKDKYDFDDLRRIVSVLRSEQGCPWDREQTHETLKPCMVEEAYEVCEAIDIFKETKNSTNLCEELGDVLLQVVMHSQISSEQNDFSLDEVIDGVSKKMIHRHPHVFEEEALAPLDSAALNKQWEELKTKEKGQSSLQEELESIPRSFPANIRALKVKKKAAKYGIEQDDLEGAFERMEESLKMLKKAVNMGKNEGLEETFGRVMFDVVNISRFLQLNAENSLTNYTNKFINKLIDVEHLAMANGAHLCDMPIDELNALWEEKK